MECETENERVSCPVTSAATSGCDGRAVCRRAGLLTCDGAGVLVVAVLS